MDSLDLKFVDGLIKKTIVLGLVATAIAFGLSGGSMALAVVIGWLVAATNLLFVRWLSHRLADAAKRGKTGAGLWTTLLLLKMTVLFGLVWYLISRLGIDALGFAAGFSVFLPAIGWQAWASNKTDYVPPDMDE